ncbi:tetratricopeptide repeat protein [Thalassotalea sediminis]|uniref:tetratricopeptide repeat protein n=1 Tax=Thalassotalea sediminis TaxID=1759089 RepID=UPI0025725720|nr:hypothetical protein [Thalassotalea sediminis]
MNLLLIFSGSYRLLKLSVADVNKKATFYVAAITLTLLPLFVHSADTNKQRLASDLEDAYLALFQGDLSLAKTLIRNKPDIQSFKLLSLEIHYLIEIESIDLAEDKLEAFEQRFPDLPETFVFSAEIWREIGHQANIFVKRRYYKKAVAARIKAGELAPQKPQYMTLKASALGQSKSYGGDNQQQARLTEQIRQRDKKWGLIADINLAQNLDDDLKGLRVSQEAVKAFPDDFDVMERVAQYHWTLGQDNKAQFFFFKACQLQARNTWFAEVKWFNACYQTAVFAEEEQLNIKKGIDALHRLLKTYQLPTTQNFDIAVRLSNIATGEDVKPARIMFSRILRQSKDNALTRKARKVLLTMN